MPVWRANAGMADASGANAVAAMTPATDSKTFFIIALLPNFVLINEMQTSPMTNPACMVAALQGALVTDGC
jgi:hypothetical protein